MIRATFILSLALLLAGATFWLVAAFHPLRVQWSRPTMVYTLYVNTSRITLSTFSTQAESPDYSGWSTPFVLPAALPALPAALTALLLFRRRRRNAPGFPLLPPA